MPAKARKAPEASRAESCVPHGRYFLSGTAYGVSRSAAITHVGPRRDTPQALGLRSVAGDGWKPPRANPKRRQWAFGGRRLQALGPRAVADEERRKPSEQRSNAAQRTRGDYCELRPPRIP